MVGTVYLSHSSSLEHETGAHPERAARISAIEAELDSCGWPAIERVDSRPAARDLLEAVHTPAHVAAVQSLCERGGGSFDADTTVSAGSFAAALHAAGGVVDLVDLLSSRSARTGFSVHRPPGHHAEADRAMGFCLFNNVAVGASHALRSGAADRVMVLDWDIHHGNGTNDIFGATSSVLYVSIHGWPLYPGSGPSSDRGSGDGEGYTINLPVGHGAGDELYSSLVEHLVVPVARDYAPDLVLVSAGYDAHRADPLGTSALTEQGFAKMTASLRRLCAELEVPLGFVLEGGYDLDALAGSVRVTLEQLNAEPAYPAVAIEMHPEARAAAAGLVDRWPGLRA